VTDACGNATTFTYVISGGSPGVDPRFYLVASMTDAFGRSAALAYDPTTSLLTSITDAEGNVSSFTYLSGDVVSMTTPYGTTTFTEITNALNTVSGWTFVFPDSSQSVIENYVTSIKDTYYWDREAMAMYPSDQANGIYSHCKRTHWLWEPLTNAESPVPAWVQKSLETMTFYTYPDQPDLNSVGSINNPTTVTRMLTGNRVLFCNVFGSGVTPGEQDTITVCDQGLPTGQESVIYTVQSGDTSLKRDNTFIID
jgi:YD repeat-containing protein